ncbi:MAG: AI-2E family transporter [Myxococcales bacterium]|nr:AI-2E family transporter [Myxococcales bacterium]
MPTRAQAEGSTVIEVSPARDDRREPPRVVQIEVPVRTIVTLLTSALAVWLLVELWAIALTMVVALILVGTLSPLVVRLERRGLRRPLAMLVVVLGLLGGLSLVLLVSLPPLLSELLGLLADAPAQRDRVIAWLGERPLTAPLAGLVRDAGSEQVLSTVGAAVLAASSMAAVAFGYAVTAVALACYMLAGGRSSQAGLYAVVPRVYHVRLARILIELEVIVGGYVRGQLLTTAAITVFSFVLLEACGVPNALSLAVLAGLLDVIPFIGSWLALVLAALAGLMISQATGALVAAAMFAYVEFEGRYLVPKIYGTTLRLSATMVVLALLIGGKLLGVIGALLALPISAGLLMIARELRVELPGDDSDDGSQRARDQAAELAYARISAGAAPVEAVALATDIAREFRVVEVVEPPRGPAP